MGFRVRGLRFRAEKGIQGYIGFRVQGFLFLGIPFRGPSNTDYSTFGAISPISGNCHTGSGLRNMWSKYPINEYLGFR